MLAAYIEGNAFPIECNMIESLSNSEELDEMLDITSDINDNPEFVDQIDPVEVVNVEAFFDKEVESLKELKQESSEDSSAIF